MKITLVGHIFKSVCTKFHENRTYSLVADITCIPDKRTESAHNVSILLSKGHLTVLPYTLISPGKITARCLGCACEVTAGTPWRN
jgi:hypothetical protein